MPQIQGRVLCDAMDIAEPTDAIDAVRLKPRIIGFEFSHSLEAYKSRPYTISNKLI